MVNNLCFLKLNTTGLNTQNHKICEIATIAIDSGEELNLDHCIYSLINPEMNIPKETTDIHGITNEMVADAPKIHEMKDIIEACFANRVIVAHSASFMIDFLRSDGIHIADDHPTFCTMMVARKESLPQKLHTLLEGLEIDYDRIEKQAGRKKHAKAEVSCLAELYQQLQAKYPNDFGVASRTYLNVPFDDKDLAKTRGAKFDGSKSKWYIPVGLEHTVFRNWL